MVKIVFYYFLMFLVGCVHKSEQQITVSDDLFPAGVYQQDIDVAYNLEGKKQSASFQAIVKKSEKEFSMYAFAGFGISLFKIREIDGKPLEFESFDPRIQERKTFFLQIFPLIQQIFYLKTQDQITKKQPMTLNLQNVPVSVNFVNYKPQVMPTEIDIYDSKNFRFEVRTKKFEALKQ